MDRRRFLQLAASGVVAGVSTERVIADGAPGSGIGHAQATAGAARIRAVAFDGFVIFDPRPIASLAETLFPGRGAVLLDAWRTRQFEYQWLRALGNRYADFLAVTGDSLLFAARQLALDVGPDQCRQLLAQFSTLQVWPDVPDAVEALRRSGLKLVMLSNMTYPMMADGLARAGLAGHFDAILSTDAIRTFKPDPRAYRLGIDALRLNETEIVFAAFAGWDAAGAKWFGYPTYWVNRSHAPAEALGASPDGGGTDLAELVRFATIPRR